jgi:hypothetical protein
MVLLLEPLDIGEPKPVYARRDLDRSEAALQLEAGHCSLRAIPACGNIRDGQESLRRGRIGEFNLARDVAERPVKHDLRVHRHSPFVSVAIAAPMARFSAGVIRLRPLRMRFNRL